MPTPRRRLGRRGTFLCLFAGIYAAAGTGILLADAGRFDRVPVVGAFLDSPWWGLMWLVAAAAAAGVAVARVFRWGTNDGPGFTALLVPPALWSLFYLASLTTWLASGGTDGRPTALTGLAAWSTAWSVVLLVSGWPDPDPHPRLDPRRHDRDG